MFENEAKSLLACNVAISIYIGYLVCNVCVCCYSSHVYFSGNVDDLI